MAVPAFEQFSPFIAAASRRFGVPEHLIRGAMALENYRGDPALRGKAGEYGLMQLMPGTFEEMSGKYGLPFNANDPETNILAGTAYLSEQYKRFGGDPAWTLAAYNAGPGRAAKAGGDFAKLPPVTQEHLRRGARLGIFDGTNLPPPSPAGPTQQGANAMGMTVPGLLSPTQDPTNPPLGGLLGDGSVPPPPAPQQFSPWQMALLTLGAGLAGRNGQNTLAMLMGMQQAQQQQAMQQYQMQRQGRRDRIEEAELGMRAGELQRKQQEQQRMMEGAAAYADQLEKAGRGDVAAALRANPALMEKLFEHQAATVFPKLESGMTMRADGSVGYAPGYAESTARKAGMETEAREWAGVGPANAKARFNTEQEIEKAWSLPQRLGAGDSVVDLRQLPGAGGAPSASGAPTMAPPAGWSLGGASGVSPATSAPVGGGNPPGVVYRAPDQTGGPFRGNGVEAQSMNILLTGDPASPEYALAYQQMTQPRPVLAQDPTDPARTITVMVTPQLPPDIEAPAYMRRAGGAGAGGGVPAPGASGGAPRFTAEPVMGTGQEKPPTEGQARAASFGARMTEAEQRLGDVFAKGFDPTAVAEQRANIPGVGNVLASTDYQLYRQAAGDWIRAKLRKESGAVIGVEEEAQEFRTYFPQLGDSPEVIEQKRKARQTARRAILGEAGSYKPGQSGSGIPAPPPGFQVVR